MSKERLEVTFCNLDLSKNTSVALAGGGAAGIASVIMQPIEILKCRAQFNRREHISYVKESRALLSEFGIKGFYRGYWPLVWRDVPGWAIYFWSYEYLKQQLIGDNDTGY